MAVTPTTFVIQRLNAQSLGIGLEGIATVTSSIHSFGKSIAEVSAIMKKPPFGTIGFIPATISASQSNLRFRLYSPATNL